MRSPELTAARNEVVAYCKKLWDRHLVTGTSGNVSVRLDDATILATPSARSLGSLEPSEIVHVDAFGVPFDASQRTTTELPLHLAAYKARADIRCVIHTHPTFCVVWSKTRSVFPRDTVGASETLRTVAWTAFRPNGTQELADLCAGEFARDIDVVIMERHGLSVVGRSLEDAYMQTDLAEEAARIAYYSRLAGL
jgi:L-fuculose-phosphate aldolase